MSSQSDSDFITDNEDDSIDDNNDDSSNDDATSSLHNQNSDYKYPMAHLARSMNS